MSWRLCLVGLLVVVMGIGLSGDAWAQDEKGRLLTVYDRGTTQTFISDAGTVGEALEAQNIMLDPRDTVEPAIDEELIAQEYLINIYRARPVVVVDGNKRMKTISSHQTPQQIADDAGVLVYDEDVAIVRPTTNFVLDGAGLQLTIVRAVPLTLDLYGRKTTIRTQGKTVGEMLEEKQITLTTKDNLSVSKSTKIKKAMTVRIWREGKQTVTLDEEIPYSTKIVYDADRPLGYRAVKTKGTPGLKQVTYQLEVRGGVEISRVEINSLTTRKPGKQTEVIGLYNDGSGLTKSRGAQVFVDSSGVSHRETYYDLNMSVVMSLCGKSGYSVRPDGAKVDNEGYILIAANLALYPRCSIVETSLGPGRVYDTGGFVLRHPTGYDLATDWTRADGI